MISYKLQVIIIARTCKFNNSTITDAKFDRKKGIKLLDILDLNPLIVLVIFVCIKKLFIKYKSIVAV